MHPYVTWFDEISRGDVPQAGGKGANIGEMVRAGFAVPPGFVVTTDAFLHALDVAGVREDLRRLFAAVSTEDPTSLAQSSEQLRALVAKAPLPPEVRAAVAAAYAKLGGDLAVAVRSSATSEDAGTTSFAGMHESFTNVVGIDTLTERIHACWMSAYGQRVLAYRKSQRMDEEPTLAVVVQRMVNAARSGVMFTADPSSNDTSAIVIEAAFGFGEVVVGGQVEVDTYDLTKAGPRLRQLKIGRKAFKIVRAADGREQRVELADPVEAGPGAVVPVASAGSRPPAAPVPLATKLYVNLAIADHAEEVAALPVDGVGLLRAEFMLLDALGGKHPNQMIESGGGKDFVTAMGERLLKITRAFAPGPSSTGATISAPTSSAASRAAPRTSRTKKTR